MRNLYEVQDDDRPMYVVASCWNHAMDAWREVVAQENGIKPDNVFEPQGIRYVCCANDLLLAPDVTAETEGMKP